MGSQRKWCSKKCANFVYDNAKATRRREKITDEVIAKAKELYPILNEDWTDKTVEESCQRGFWKFSKSKSFA